MSLFHSLNTTMEYASDPFDSQELVVENPFLSPISSNSQHDMVLTFTFTFIL